MIYLESRVILLWFRVIRLKQKNYLRVFFHCLFDDTSQDSRYHKSPTYFRSSLLWAWLRRCWSRSEGHHGEKIKNGSFASDLRSVHISRYAIKIPWEIVWYGHYRSFSAFKRYNMRCSFEIFLRKGGRNRRLLLASQNCYFLCRRDNFRDRNNAVRINTSFLHVVKVLDFERKLLFSALLTSDFFPGTLTCALRILIFSSKINIVILPGNFTGF